MHAVHLPTSHMSPRPYHDRSMCPHVLGIRTAHGVHDVDPHVPWIMLLLLSLVLMRTLTHELHLVRRPLGMAKILATKSVRRRHVGRHPLGARLRAWYATTRPIFCHLHASHGPLRLEPLRPAPFDTNSC